MSVIIKRIGGGGSTLTSDQEAAITGANAPSAGNPFVTTSDLPETLDTFSVSTAGKTALEDSSNWDANGTYIGASITGSEPGMTHYTENAPLYKYECMPHSVNGFKWIRLILG